MLLNSKPYLAALICCVTNLIKAFSRVRCRTTCHPRTRDMPGVFFFLKKKKKTKQSKTKPTPRKHVSFIYSTAIVQLKGVSVIVNKIATVLLSKTMDCLVIKLIKRLSLAFFPCVVT